MLILAIDTSGKNGSIVLARANADSNSILNSDSDDELDIIEAMTLSGGTFSAQLVPQIAALLTSNGFTKSDIGGFAVAAGPGSFTGLRVGLAAVKALGEVLQKPIAAVSLLEASVVSSGAEGRLMAALDAGRGDVYVGEYEMPHRTQPSREYLLSRAEFILQARGWKVVTPDAAMAEAAVEGGLEVKKIQPITAEDVARLGWQKLKTGVTVTPEQLEANYIRRTDAEMLERIRA